MNKIKYKIEIYGNENKVGLIEAEINLLKAKYNYNMKVRKIEN